MKGKQASLVLAALFILFTVGCFAQTAHPAWLAQSNIYEVNLRQFSNAGTVKEFEKSLPRLKAMGVDILWFMPITPIGKVGRKMTDADLGSYYAVRDYKGFNEEFGTMADWKALVRHAHSMGFKVITDWVANHSAIDNPWMKDHPDFYAKDKDGNVLSPYDWTDVRKFNYASAGLRDSMIGALKFWVTETGIDGFRCDVADDVPADFWKQAITALRKIKNVFMLAEGAKPELHDAGFDATYAWEMMRVTTDVYAGKKNLVQLDSALNADIKMYPANAWHMYFTTNHDENSWNGTEFEKYGDAYKTFAVFSQTMYHSVPLIYNGQEVMNRKRLKFFVKDVIEWNDRYEMAPFYATLLKLRHSNPALAAGASYKRLASSNDAAIFAYQRVSGSHKVVVILNLSKQAQSFTIKDAGINGRPLNVFGKAKEKLNAGHSFTLEPWGYLIYDYQ